MVQALSNEQINKYLNTMAVRKKAWEMAEEMAEEITSGYFGEWNFEMQDDGIHYVYGRVIFWECAAEELGIECADVDYELLDRAGRRAMKEEAARWRSTDSIDVI